MPKRVLICGGRNFTDYQFLSETLLRELAPWLPDVEIIQGAARGADMLAAKFAWHHCSVKSRFFPILDAEWEQLGKGAGHNRNARMLAQSGADLVIAFPGQGGTADMCAIAGKAGVEVRRIEMPDALAQMKEIAA